MDFGYTPEQNQLRKNIREFTEAEMRPHVSEWDESQEFPLGVFRELGKMGVLGAVFPEDLGGSGYNYVDYSILMEEVARVDPSIALSLAAHVSLCTNHIYLAGNREQHEKYIPKLASGEWIGCWSLTEPEAGSDGGNAHKGGSRERRLGAEREQDVHDQRTHRGCVCGDGDDGPVAIGTRDFGVHSRKRHGGISHRQEGKQAGDALFAYRRSAV